MKIIKRNGAEENFDISKIIMAVTKANAAVEECDRMTPRQIQRIAESVELACQELGRSAAVEEIQDMVEKQIIDMQLPQWKPSKQKLLADEQQLTV